MGSFLRLPVVQIRIGKAMILVDLSFPRMSRRDRCIRARRAVRRRDRWAEIATTATPLSRYSACSSPDPSFIRLRGRAVVASEDYDQRPLPVRSRRDCRSCRTTPEAGSRGLSTRSPAVFKSGGSAMADANGKHRAHAALRSCTQDLVMTRISAQGVIIRLIR